MRLIRNTSTEPAVLETLDQLWKEASEIGAVEVDKGFGGQVASIRFETANGSWVNARGKHSDIHQALRMAITEANQIMQAAGWSKGR